MPTLPPGAGLDGEDVADGLGLVPLDNVAVAVQTAAAGLGEKRVRRRSVRVSSAL